MQTDKENRINELQKKISRANIVINEVKQSQAWRIIMEDFSASKQRIDDNWHLVKSGDPKLEEFRITKLAIASILDTFNNYEYDIRKATEEIYAIEHPEEITSRDYDPE